MTSMQSVKIKPFAQYLIKNHRLTCQPRNSIVLTNAPQMINTAAENKMGDHRSDKDYTAMTHNALPLSHRFM